MNLLQTYIGNKRSDVQLLIEYLQDRTGTVVLATDLSDKHSRLSQVADWIRKYGSREKVVQMICNNTWKRKDGTDYKVDQRTAYRDYVESQELFAINYNNNKAFWLDMLIGMVVETRNRALAGDKKDLKVAAAQEKLLHEIITTHMGDKEAEIYKELHPLPLVMAFLPESKRKLPDNWEEQVQRIIEKKNQQYLSDDLKEEADEQ